MSYRGKHAARAWAGKATIAAAVVIAGVSYAGAASASTPDCAFGDGCATLHGSDAAGNGVALDAKYQNKHQILIGYPDKPGDGATSFDGVLHFASSHAHAYTDTSFQADIVHPVCGPVPSNALSTSGSGTSNLTVTPASGDSLAHDSLPGNVTASAPNSNGAVTFGDNGTTSGSFNVTEAYNGAGCVIALHVTVDSNGHLNASATELAGAINRTYPVGGVLFSDPMNNPGSFSFSGLPGGVVVNGGELVVGGSSAIPNSYSSIGVTYTDAFGAKTTDAFRFVVEGNKNPLVNHTPYYTFVYAPNGTWTNQCVTDVNGSGALKLEQCTLGRDQYQDFLALDNAGTAQQIADSTTTYHFQDVLASVAHGNNSCLIDHSTLNPGTPQTNTTDEAPGGRQLRVDGDCTTTSTLWSWNT